MLPLFLPPGVTFDKLLRALIGVSLFAVRLHGGGGARRPAGDPQGPVRGRRLARPRLLAEDAADHPAAGAEARDPRHRQHLHRPVQGHQPGLSSSACSTCSASSSRTSRDANWASPQTPASGYVFAACVFWMFCFGMSRYSSIWNAGSTPATNAKNKKGELADGHRKRSQRGRDQGRRRQDAHLRHRCRDRHRRHAQMVRRVPRAEGHQPAASCAASASSSAARRARASRP